MPFKSKAQRAYMHIHHPTIADRWEDHTPKGKKLPEHVSKKESAFYSQGKLAALKQLGLVSR
jgi:hypothetical protein